MLYSEFLEVLKNGGAKDGDSLWVVDFRHDDIMHKPLRNIPPTEVRLTLTSGMPPVKNVATNSIYHFRAYSKTGKLSASALNPYDNTAGAVWRGGVNVFFTKEEANEFYREQCEKVKAQIVLAQQQWNQRFNDMLADVATRVNGL